MKNKRLLALITMILTAFILTSTVEAKRFGGGSSFGSKKSYSSPFKQKSTQQKSFSQQKASATNQQRKQQLSKSGGLMGMLGGLALGGLLGALFFGGAFEGFNFLDFLMIAGVIFAIYWFMKRKRTAPPMQQTTPGGFDMNTPPSSDDAITKSSSDKQQSLGSTQQDASFTKSFSANKNSSPENNKDSSFADSFGVDYGNSASSDSDPNPSNPNEVILPSWFNQEEFLSGARSAYTLLQQAWDEGDIESIKSLTTEKVYEEIALQMEQEPSQGATRIVQLNSQLVDFNELEDHTEAAVIFDALLGETDSEGQQERTSQVKELWHFVQGKNSSEPTWYLDGIQQLE